MWCDGKPQGADGDGSRKLGTSGLQKHHRNSTRRHPERDKKSEMVAGEGKKESEILGGPARVVWRRVQGSPNQQQPQP